MRLLSIALCGLVGGMPAAAVGQIGPSAPPLTVQVGIFAIHPDGSAVGLAFGADERAFEPFASVIIADDCRFGAGGGPDADGRDVWRIRGQVISLSREEAILHLDWQRIRAGRVAVRVPAQSGRFALPVNQLHTIEPLPRSGDVTCDFPPTVFGVRYAASPRIPDAEAPRTFAIPRPLGIR